MITITSDTLLLHTDRHARVTAGPGAGKTYWLVQHTTNVLTRSPKLHPHARLAIISYTNVAADSLREKLGPHAASEQMSARSTASCTITSSSLTSTWSRRMTGSPSLMCNSSTGMTNTT